MIGANFTHLAGAKIVCQGGAFLLGLIIDASSDGGNVTVYEGQDRSSGRKIATIKGFEDITNVVNFPAKIYCQRGIYVGDFSHIDSVTIFWERPE